MSATGSQRANMRRLFYFLAFYSGLFGAEKVSKPGQYSGWSEPLYSEWVRFSQYIAMPDGVKLAIDIYRPAQNGKAVQKPYPVVWEGTTARGVVANGKMQLSAERVQNGESILDLTRFGYVVAEVDRRGLGASYGVMVGYHNRAETRGCVRRHRMAGAAALVRREHRYVRVFQYGRGRAARVEHGPSAPESDFSRMLRMEQIRRPSARRYSRQLRYRQRTSLHR